MAAMPYEQYNYNQQSQLRRDLLTRHRSSENESESTEFRPLVGPSAEASNNVNIIAPPSLPSHLKRAQFFVNVPKVSKEHVATVQNMAGSVTSTSNRLTHNFGAPAHFY